MQTDFNRKHFEGYLKHVVKFVVHVCNSDPAETLNNLTCVIYFGNLFLKAEIYACNQSTPQVCKKKKKKD